MIDSCGSVHCSAVLDNKYYSWSLDGAGHLHSDCNSNTNAVCYDKTCICDISNINLKQQTFISMKN